MVIFGAGASYDSDPERPAGEAPRTGVPGVAHRPPLAADLVAHRYGSIANEYPASVAVIDYVRQRLGGGPEDTLETLLAQYAERAENSTAARQSLIAFRFYLCQLITDMSRQWVEEANGHTVYLTLLNNLLEWQEETAQRVQLVTFNYDTLLEDAAKRVLPDWDFDDMGAYVQRVDWGLLKLHGSINWSRVLEHPPSQGSAMNTSRAISAAAQFADTSLPLTMRNATTVQMDAGPQVYLPGIAVPMANKTAFECESVQVEAFRSTIPEIEHLLICGWRGAEAHAVEILSEIRPGYRLGIVTGGRSDLAEIQGNLGDVYRKGKLELTQTGGMSAFARDMRSDLGAVLKSVREP